MVDLDFQRYLGSSCRDQHQGMPEVGPERGVRYSQLSFGNVGLGPAFALLVCDRESHSNEAGVD